MKRRDSEQGGPQDAPDGNVHQAGAELGPGGGISPPFPDPPEGLNEKDRKKWAAGKVHRSQMFGSGN
jgi:hypothetical protein